MNPWVGLVGKGKLGRSAKALELAEVLKGRGLSVGGLVHQRRDDRGHDAIHLGTGERTTLTTVSQTPDVCEYAFAPGVFETCRQWLLAPPAQVTFVELGRVEGQRKGHWDATMELMSGPSTLVVALLRPSALSAVALGLPDPADFAELPLEGEALTRFADAIAQLA